MNKYLNKATRTQETKEAGMLCKGNRGSPRQRWGLSLGLLGLSLLLTGCPAPESEPEPVAEAEAEPEPVPEADPEPEPGAEAEPALETIPVTLAWSRGFSWAQIAYAIEAGLFEEEGLEVEVVDFVTGRDAMAAVIGGAADFSNVAETPAAVGAIENQPFRILADTGRTSARRIVTRADTGIETLSDLEGRRVAVTVGTDAQLFLEQALASVGLTADDVEAVNVSPPDMVPALTRGDVDALATWQPNYARAEEALGNDYVDIPFTEEANHYLVVASEGILESRPEAAERFLRTLYRADEVFETTDDLLSVQELVAEGSGWDLELIIDIWEDYDFEVLLTDESLSKMQLVGQWAVERDLVSGTADIETFLDQIDEEPLTAVDPARVQFER